MNDALDVLRGMPGAERFVTFLTEHPDAVRRDHRGAHLTASALVVDATATRVLLCLHGRVGKWLQLGGHIEDGDETLAAAALREAREESGIDGLLISADPIDVDIHPVRCSGGDSVHWDVRYAVLAPPGAVEQVSAESAALGWFTPDALPSPLGEAVDRMIEPALAWARGRLTATNTGFTA